MDVIQFDTKNVPPKFWNMQDLLDRLVLVDHLDWYITENDCIRVEKINQCPVCAIVHAIYPEITLKLMANEALELAHIFMPFAELKLFMDAADGDYMKQNYQNRQSIIRAINIRRELLEAFNLKENE